MLTKELVLRTLRANLVRALRVIVPGPKTQFPLIRVSPDGSHSVVPDLEAANGIPPDGGFFMEMAEASRVTRILVRGFSAEAVPEETASPDAAADYSTFGGAIDAGELGSDSGLDLAVRAAYCLGMDSAVVTVGYGSDESAGPKVFDVLPGVGEPQTGETWDFAFLGANVEYLRVDTCSYGPTPSLHKVWFSADELARDGRLRLPASLAAEAAAAQDLWVSSPCPEVRAAAEGDAASTSTSPSPFSSGVPLSTRLVFRGVPNPTFLRCLDRTVALLGMFLSPAEESRARHATPEGVLGAMRRPGGTSTQYAGVPGEVFEYPSVPSLLWSPERLVAIMSLAAAVASHAEDFARALKLNGLVDLAANLRRQKAYYDADKAYFREEMWALADLLSGLPRSGIERNHSSYRAMQEALRAVPQNQVCVTVGLPDFRPAWGIPQGSEAVRCGSIRLLGPAAGLPRTRPACVVPSGFQGEKPVIGPVFGIMAKEKTASEHRKDKFGIETDRFIRMLRMAESMGMLAYVFFPEDTAVADSGPEVDNASADALIPVWVHRPWSGWVRRMAPLPDVVYDRHIPQVLLDGTTDEVAARFLGRLPHIKFINSLPFTHACRDKMKAHRILLEDPVVAVHLPETMPVSDVDSAVRFIASHETSFLKPLRGTGSKGLTVFRRCVSTGGEHLRFRVSQRCLDGSIRDIKEVLDLAGVEALLRSMAVSEDGQVTADKARFVLQEGIRTAHLPEDAGSAFEVRVIYQKGGLGKWRRTGMVCRVNPGREGFIVPGKELHRRVDDVLGSVFPGRVSEIKEQIRVLARRIPPLIEAASGYGGEMSIDLGIDCRGKPWLIEINSKPATLFRDLGAFNYRQLSLRRVLNFASFLHAK